MNFSYNVRLILYDLVDIFIGESILYFFLNKID